MRTSKKVLSNVLHTPHAEISSLALSALLPICLKLGKSIGVNRGSSMNPLFSLNPFLIKRDPGPFQSECSFQPEPFFQFKGVGGVPWGQIMENEL